MSCGEPCDGCSARAEHHLCDECVHEDIDAMRARAALGEGTP